MPAEPPTVLVVEDEVLVRMAVSDYLRECGYRVVEAGSAEEAIKVLEGDVRIDVVFTDVQMPGAMDGFGLARWARRERPSIRVILTTGVARAAQQAGDLCEEGPMMAKPYSNAELERWIRSLLER